MRRVLTYICGDGGPMDEYNPSKITRQKHVPKLLFLLNSEPLTADELSKRLNISIKTVNGLLQDLLRINAVFEKDKRWYISFPIFTKQDIHFLFEKTREPALKLAKEIMRMEPKLKEHLSKLSCAKQVEINKLMFAVVGCFVLDWKALKLLNERDLSLCGKKQQPGGRKYVLIGREDDIEEELYDRMYWGSHSDEIGGITFTSFGDHTGCRYAFPDLAWSLSMLPERKKKEKSPDWFWSKVVETLNIFQKNCLIELGRILLLLNDEGPMSMYVLREKLEMEKDQAESLLKMLADMRYISLSKEKARLNYPVFTAEDEEIIEDIWQALSHIVEREACEYFNSLKTELAEITPIRRGIDPREIYTDVWHWIFGWANRIMAERGLFFDPPKEREGEGRYIAWISTQGIRPLL
jgi:predicted transcriptional regulator